MNLRKPTKRYVVAFLLGYGAGFLFWLAIIAAIAIGGAITDQLDITQR